MPCSEKRSIPVLSFISLVLEVTTLCTRNWMNGFYGDIVVLTLCPWRLCHLNCLHCAHEKPTLECFRIRNWDDTGFKTFSVVSHLEYWVVGFLTMALLVSVLDCGHSYIKRFSRCQIDLSKPILMVLMVGSLLSTVSVAMFGANLNHSTTEVTTYDSVTLHFSWPYALRIVATVLAWGATVAAICDQCRSTSQTNIGGLENVMIVTSPREFDEDSLDEAETGVLL